MHPIILQHSNLRKLINIRPHYVKHILKLHSNMVDCFTLIHTSTSIQSKFDLFTDIEISILDYLIVFNVFFLPLVHLSSKKHLRPFIFPAPLLRDLASFNYCEGQVQEN